MIPNKPTVSVGTLIQRAEQFQMLFEGSYENWTVCGSVRRGRAGDELVHLCRPKFDGGCNAVWRRAVEMGRAGDIGPWREIEDPHRNSWVSEEHALIECRHADHPFKHTIVRGSHATWGMLLARYTGPASFWRFLLARLQFADVLKIHNGHVCWMDRSNHTPTPRPIECPDEQEFFQMCRTAWKEPKHRYDVLDDGRWQRGMLKEYYPASVTVFASPTAQPSLFPNDKPALSALDPRARAVRMGKRRRTP